MSSKPIERAGRSFSLRLNLWYSAFFICASFALFVLAYFLLSTTIQQKEKEVIRSKLEEYRAWYEGGGLDGLRQKFLTTRASDKNAFFVRVIGVFNNALFFSIPEDWQDFDASRIETVNVEEARPWFSLTGKSGERVWMFATARLFDGRLLQVGKSTETATALLAHFRVVSGLAMIAVVIVGFLGGAYLTHKALFPIRQLIHTVRDIIETGRMDARVPPRTTHDELDELVHLFNRMLEKNEALIRGMREALDHVAHDLRTPMARLRGSAETALQAPDEPGALREALADAMEESERVLTMLKTLMDISEAETGAMRLNLETINLSALVQDVIGLYEIVAEEKKVTVLASLPEELILQADRVRLQQVLANLLDNAIKYNVPAGQVEITAQQKNQQVVITVQDSGIGIPAEELPRIWDRLFRGDKSRSQKGLGLGLSLVKAIVEAHHGTVEVASQPDKGSRFIISLPNVPG